jgi:hypothetical protein
LSLFDQNLHLSANASKNVKTTGKLLLERRGVLWQRTEGRTEGRTADMTGVIAAFNNSFAKVNKLHYGYYD